MLKFNLKSTLNVLTEVLVIKDNRAFTLAEVLITLGIIGIVAALTIPTLLTEHAKRSTVTQLKKHIQIFPKL